jgi:N-acetylglucosamine kinase-like BadF-type ATPase
MILIADSGSTKTDWRLVTDTEVLPFSTIGFNPYHVSDAQVLTELNASTLKDKTSLITQVYFYGAGCSSAEKSNLIKEALLQFFKNAKVEVHHDLLAAARATCGKNAGMTAILGTGSNSCLFEGENIIENIPALGYILGDEGSGVDMGKMLIKKYLNKELSSNLSEKLAEEYSLNLNTILNAVYKESLPNRYLAQFTLFIKKYEEESEMDELVKNCFQHFFDLTICKYKNYEQYPLNVVGSIANVFSKQLKEVALNNKVEIGKIVKSPIDELVLFHTRN